MNVGKDTEQGHCAYQASSPYAREGLGGLWLIYTGFARALFMPGNRLTRVPFSSALPQAS
jgi:hypothetical protein